VLLLLLLLLLQLSEVEGPYGRVCCAEAVTGWHGLTCSTKQHTGSTVLLLLLLQWNEAEGPYSSKMQHTGSTGQGNPGKGSTVLLLLLQLDEVEEPYSRVC
jgi:hypothetical protein